MHTKEKTNFYTKYINTQNPLCTPWKTMNPTFPTIPQTTIINTYHIFVNIVYFSQVIQHIINFMHLYLPIVQYHTYAANNCPKT